MEKPSCLIFRQEQWVPQELHQVFAFFERPENLSRLTPPWLHFKILSASPVPMQQGTEIEYQIKVRGLRFRWRSVISDYAPPYHFTDTQMTGPYRTWVHTHSFTKQNGGTLIQDEVRYSLPLGILGRIVNRLWVKADLARIFGYRREQISSFFPTPAKSQATVK